MISNSFTVLSNLAERTTYTNAKVVGSGAFEFCASPTVLKTSVKNDFIFGHDVKKPFYIYYINLNREEGFEILYKNKTINLLKEKNINKIRKMADFVDDWNGTGGKAFSESAIKLFEEIVEILVKQPQIAPTGRNSLLMQYELEDKSLLAFEVSEKKTEKVYIPKGDYALAQVETFTENVGYQINKCVERFYEIR